MKLRRTSGSFWLPVISIDEKQEFIDGYGLDFEQIERMIPLIRAFNIVNYAPAVETAANCKEGDRLKDFRLRLRGYLDLYCSASV